MWVGIVIQQFDILILVVENTRAKLLESQVRKIPRQPFQLRFGLIQMIVVEMHISQRMNELTWPQTCRTSHHHRQQSVRGDIERYS